MTAAWPATTACPCTKLLTPNPDLFPNCLKWAVGGGTGAPSKAAAGLGVKMLVGDRPGKGPGLKGGPPWGNPGRPKPSLSAMLGSGLNTEEALPRLRSEPTLGSC